MATKPKGTIDGRSAVEPAAPAYRPRPLVVLSNRGPYVRRTVRGEPHWVRSVGGLVSALDPVVRARAGIWLASAEPGSDAPPPSSMCGYELRHIDLSDEEIDGYYRRVANGVLWPLLHSFPSRVRTKDAPWEIYREVNQRFARAAAEARSDAIYWAQDFQLMVVPAALRALRPQARIGWFNHVPWPAPEIFAMLPERDEAIEGLLGADLLGFQTSRDASNFVSTVAELTRHAVDRDEGLISVEDRVVRVAAFPIGIDVDVVQTLAADPDVRARRERLRAQFGHTRVLLSVDRLDYTKGMPERFLAFALMLERYAELRQRVMLVQVAVPSRTDVPEYAALKREVDELVGQINGRFATPNWTPIQYLYRSFDLSDLVALYGAADVALITPLRDGMNLVAHEFAAARLDNTGALVLSEFAGAATLLDGAVLVNPLDIARYADAIAATLAMPLDEQVERMRRVRAAVRKHRVGLWQSRFLSALEGARPERGSHPPAFTSDPEPFTLTDLPADKRQDNDWTRSAPVSRDRL